jgi:ribonuclease BN (tRNA processing enzyme)
MQKLSKTGTCLITLGTAAGPSLRPDRAQSSNLLTVNGTHYVVDAGDGVARRLAKAGIDIREMGTIFTTHHHDDHTAGLGTLMSLAWGVANVRSRSTFMARPGQKSWSKPLCSISA